jgi:hypothetical protein
MNNFNANLSSSVAVFTVVGLVVLGLQGKTEAQSPESNLDTGFPWEYQARALPGDRIPHGARLRAWEHLQEWKLQHKPRLSTNSGPDELWVSIGPAPINLSDCTGCGIAGRTTCIAVNPSDTNHWYLGGAQGGVWETRDAGNVWRPLTDDQASLAMGALAIARSNPQILYAGTGEPNNSIDSYAGAGLLKSTDGGVTWQLLGANVFAGESFSAITVDPKNPDILLAATKTGIAGRGQTFVPDAPPTGVFRSTDGGVTWTQTLDGRASSLVSSPMDFSRQYAGVGYRTGSSSNGVYRSADGGITWTRLLDSTFVPGRVQLAIASSNPDMVYASIANQDTLVGVWVTTNAWASSPTWSPLPTLTNSFGQWSYDHTITVDPSKPSRIYLGGQRLWTFDGSSWAEITTSWRWADLHAFAWAGTRLIVCDDGRAYSTPDGGQSWINHSQTLRLTQFYVGAIHPTKPNFALGGSQDVGVTAWTNSTSWNEVRIGDGLGVAISAARPDTDWALAFANLAIRRTTDGGNTFIHAESGISTSSRPFSASIAMSPANSDVLIAGADRLWKCTNFFSSQDPTWFANSDPVAGHLTALAFAFTDSTSDTYAFGTTNGQVSVTVDGGVTWTQVQGSLPGRWITSLVFNPTNAAILYATLSGFDATTPGSPGHVFKTTNALDASPTWHDISPPIDLPCNVITLDPFHPDTLYVGADIGIWKSTDDGNSWFHEGPETGMPNVAVFDVKASATGRVIAFTHGRGAFALVPIDLLHLTVGTSPTNTTVSWPSIVPNAVLESTEELGSKANWVAYPFAPEQVNDLNVTVVNSAGGQWIGVGDNGTILASLDGVSWAARNSGTDSFLSSVAYGNGLWKAVGASGTILSSADGVTWTNQNIGTTIDLDGIGHGAGLWVAVGSSGDIITSRDGATWMNSSSDTNLWLTSVAYGNGEWAAVDAFGTIISSPDGIAWTKQASGTTTFLSSLRYANGLWVAVGDTILTSTDARIWNVQDMGTNTFLDDVGYGNGQWVAIGDDGTIHGSANGATWEARASVTGNLLQSVSYGQGTWVLVGSDGIFTSSDAATWSLRASGMPYSSLSKISYGPFVTNGGSKFFRLRLK